MSEDVFDVRINVSKELADHYAIILKQRDDLVDNNNAEYKDVVAILNATTSIIKDLSRIQSELYNSEKFAVLQQVVIDVLKEVDPMLQHKVVEAYEERIARMT